MQNNRNHFFQKFRDWNLRLYKKRLNTPPYLDLNTFFKEHNLLENNWKKIRDEINHVIKETNTLPKFHEIDDGQEYISDNDGIAWSLFNIKLYDMWHSDNMKRCPVTVSLLSKINNVKSIYFSILSPGKHIPPHYGPYMGVFRYQLALSVPKQGNCELIVDGKSYHWKEGEGVMFDDTFIHEVKNETSEKRIALLLDIKRNDFKGLFYYYDLVVFKLIQLLIIINNTFKKSTA
tara:strand:+ start:86 stop:784 length:699 start_codon:yes stop_codon:yes gene_type:complete